MAMSFLKKLTKVEKVVAVSLFVAAGAFFFNMVMSGAKDLMPTTINGMWSIILGIIGIAMLAFFGYRVSMGEI